MRKMKNKETGRIVEVEEFFMTKNMWEFYVIKPKEDEPQNTEDIKFCLVLGYENEFGDVSMSEVKPHMITRTKNLQEVAAAIDYEWVE
jgi:hypothetical protein